MTDGKKVRWGIIGPGGIAKAFLGGLNDTESGELVAIGSRNPSKPSLKDDFPGARIHDGYQALIDDAEVDAIYIATPHPGHSEWAVKCADAGKHVLSEKPMGLSAGEAMTMFAAAKRNGTFMGEAFMYRLHPQTAKLVELLKSGVIGEIRMIKSSFGFALPDPDPKHRLYANELAGGGILDVGCYPASMSRLIAGLANGKPFLDPELVSGTAYLGKTGVDEWASAILKFPGGIIAEISCSVSLNQENVLRVVGTKGRIEVADFWFAGGKEGGVGKIIIVKEDGTRDVVEVQDSRHLYSFEADSASKAILAGKKQFDAPGMTWADTMGNMRVLDKWRADSGLVYGIETPQPDK